MSTNKRPDEATGGPSPFSEEEVASVTEGPAGDPELDELDAADIDSPDELEHSFEKILAKSKKLNETQFIPLFVGIALGVIVGVIPIRIPGMSMPVRLGLAGGPLIVGMVRARVGHVGGLVWHMTPSVNLAFRELGITLFLAAVGLTAGERFFETVWTRTM